MLIYGPQPDAEFAPVVGGLSEAQFELFEHSLRRIVPAIRYSKARDQRGHPAVPRFTLSLHQDDRERAIALVHETMDRISPYLPGVRRFDSEIAATVRQVMRARQADDRIASELMERYLGESIQCLLAWLFRRAKMEWSVELTLDGLAAEDVELVQPFELRIQGTVALLTTGTHEPFEAELGASAHGSALERFAARFGDRARLRSEGVIRRDVMESYPIDDAGYCVRVGSSVPRKDGQLVEWGFEIVKE